MGATKAQIKASEKWLKAHGNERYDRVQLVFPKGYKAKAMAKADAKGLSLSAYVMQRIRDDRKQKVDALKFFLSTSNAGDDLRKGTIMKKIIFNDAIGLEKDVMAIAPYQEDAIKEFEKATGKTFPVDVFAELAVTDEDIGEDGSVSEERDQMRFEILKEDILRQMEKFGIDSKYLLFTSDGCEGDDEEDEEEVDEE